MWFNRIVCSHFLFKENQDSNHPSTIIIWQIRPSRPFRVHLENEAQISVKTLSGCLDSATCVYVLFKTRFSSFFFLVAALVDFLSVNSAFVHCSWTHKFHFLTTFSLKMGPTILFTHLKIILLQCFQFLIFSFSKINSIQTD